MVNDMLRQHNYFMDMMEKMTFAVPKVAGARICACIVHRKNPVSFGTNLAKTHPLQAKFGRNPESIYLHAEICAIKNALKKIDVDFLKKCTMYVCRTRIIKDNDCWGIAKPCDGCMSALETFGIKKVVYSVNSINENNKEWNEIIF